MNRLSNKLVLALLLLTMASTLMAQTTESGETIKLEDLKTWRNSSVTLSDDGRWYTVLYTLYEKPDEKSEKPKEKGKEGEEKKGEEEDIYGKSSQTDVLYIHSADSDKVYEIPKGSRPQFSPCSRWIAYAIKSEEKGKKKNETVIELRNLDTGKTRRWTSNASFSFAEKHPYFLTAGKNDLLLFNLETEKEHFIGSIGEYILNKDSSYLLYSIASSDKRGNGIYLYDLEKYYTFSLDTENCLYGNLAWNWDRSAVSALKYQKEKEEEPKDIRLITCDNIKSGNSVVKEYASSNFKGMPKDMRLDVEKASFSRTPAWSKDNKRLFVRLKKANATEEKEKKEKPDPKEKSTVDVWHWKDKKLVSQQMMEAKREDARSYMAIFVPASKTVIPLTGPEMESIYWAPDTDSWAVGGDNRPYISDWDIEKEDLYRIDLTTGERSLFLKKYDGRVNISPDGKNAVLWNDGHYWNYNFEANLLTCISKNVTVSFIDAEYDQWGFEPDYGFVAWTKDQKSVVVNHKFDLWRLYIDGKTPAENLTGEFRGDKSIRFRFDDPGSIYKPEPDERFIDLSKPQIVRAFDIYSKEAGFCQMDNGKLNFLVFGPASYGASRRWGGSQLIKAKNSDKIIYHKGDYKNYPEAYLSNLSFEKPHKITETNPQQSKYKWGKRILISYKNDDGEPLQGILSVPDGYKKGQKLPMIVYTYEKLSQNLFNYPSMRIGGAAVAEMLYVSDDYLFLQPDIHFNVGTPHSDMHECIDAAIREVIRLGYVDEKAIGYEGFSFGGHCGMYISTQKNRFAAIAAGAGVSNLVQGFTLDIVRDGSNEQDYYMTQQGRLGEGPEANLEMYIRESAVFQAHHLDTPLLLFHGTTDNVVQWEHSFGLFSILRYLKKPVIFLSYKGEGHGLRQKANRFDIQKRLKEYFDHFLKGKEAPEWIKEGIPYQAEKAKGKEKKPASGVMWK